MIRQLSFVICPFPICLCLWLVNSPLVAQSGAAADPLPTLVQVLRETRDAQLQLDVLKGLSAAFRGRRQVPMPKGWEALETSLGRSANADVRALAQSLSLMFGSARALAALRQTLGDPSADLTARRAALNSLLDIKDAGLPPILQSLLTNAQ